MKIKFLDAKQVGKKLKKLMDSTEEFYWAVAWATDIEFANSLLENKDKICQLVIGTDYLGTDPSVLRKLKDIKTVRVMFKGQATFHPKIYCFVKGEEFSAIVGSSNLTNGGLSSNEEASVLIEGTTEDDFFKEISNKISSWWKMGVQIEDDWLSRYEKMWSKNKENRAKTKKLVDAIQPIKKELPTIAEFNVENPPRIHIAWWIENIDKNNYSEEDLKDRNFLDEMTFLKDDDVQEGDWILSWKCEEDGSPDESVRMNWIYVDEVIKNGYLDGSNYTKLAVQTKKNYFLIPFELDSKVELIITKLLKPNEFKNAFSFNSENWHCPEQDEVKEFLKCVKLKYENGSK